MENENRLKSECAKCHIEDKICKKPDGKFPKFCATILYPKAIQDSIEELSNEKIKHFVKMASLQEAECYAFRENRPSYRYPTKPRIQEIIEFAKKMDFKRLGIAFCLGFSKEAEILTKILENNGFEVVSVVCKVGGKDKELLGLKDHEKIRIGEYESMCNPIAQAKVLNEAETDFNIMLGLCVGHDSLFIKFSEAMTTVFAVKDRLLGHNPLAAIYTSHSYYNRFLSSDYKV